MSVCLSAGYARTFIFWARKYGEPYSSNKPSFSQWQSGHNFLSLIPPVGAYRLYVWYTYSNLSAPAVPVAEKVDSHTDDNPISVVGVPVMEPGTIPRNQLSRNISDSKTTTSSSTQSTIFVAGYTGGCAGSCGSSGGCAAGSCGAGGCGGSCGGRYKGCITRQLLLLILPTTFCSLSRW